MRCMITASPGPHSSPPGGGYVLCTSAIWRNLCRSKSLRLCCRRLPWPRPSAVPVTLDAQRGRAECARCASQAMDTNRDGVDLEGRMARKRSVVRQQRLERRRAAVRRQKSGRAHSATRIGKRPTTCRTGTSGMSPGPRRASTTSTTTAIAESRRTSGTSTSKRSAASTAIATARSTRPSSSAAKSTTRAPTASTISTGTTTDASSGRNGTGAPAVFTDLDRNRDGVLSRFEVVGGVDTPNDTWDQFASLDYNRNGSLARDEWHWSATSFNRHDTNRDGMLSRQEFAAGGGAPDAVGTAGTQQQRTVRVNGTAALDRLGHHRARRRHADARRERQRAAERRCAGRGQRRPARRRTAARPMRPMLNQLAGGLLARIDDYGPIFIGGRPHVYGAGQRTAVFRRQRRSPRRQQRRVRRRTSALRRGRFHVDARRSRFGR